MPFRRVALLVSFFAAIVIAPLARADDVVLYAEQDTACPVKVTADKKWQVLKIRISPGNADGKRCRIDKEKTLTTLEAAFRVLAERDDTTRYKSVFLGRVEFHDWLSRHLVDRASAHPDWSTETGRPARGKNINGLVNEILGEPVILDALRPAVRQGGYRPTGFSCEKVLVSSSGTRRVEPVWASQTKHVPYDALCWLKLVKVGG
jgi:hypothetical protein